MCKLHTKYGGDSIHAVGLEQFVCVFVVYTI